MKRYLSLIVLIALMLSIFSLSYALTVQIGDGTATTRRLPIDGYYHFTYSQQIYTQSQIGQGGSISKIRFYYASGSLTNSQGWRIYLGHTQKTAFSSASDWETPAGLTEVFDGDVSSLLPAAGNWMEIPLTTPFTYNNTDNLVVAVHQYTSGWTSSYLYCGAFTSGADTGMYYRSDSTDFDIDNPGAAYSTMYSDINRIQLVFPDTVAPAAPTLVSPVNGAQVMAGQLLCWTQPTGPADATGYDVYIDDTMVSSNQEGTTYALPASTSVGTHTWYVKARNSIGVSPASATGTFEFVNGVIIGTGTSNQTYPFYVNYGYTRSLSLYTEAQIGQTGQITTLGWSVATPKATLIPYKIYIKPTSETALAQMPWADFTTGATVVKEGEYAFDSAGWHNLTLDAPFPYTGGNLLIGVEVNYGGSGAGYQNIPYFHYTTGTTDSNQRWYKDGSEPTDNGSLSTNLPNVLMLFVPLPTNPVFSINPAGYDFGSLIINTTSSQTFTIMNAGGGTLNVTGISPTSDGFFSVTDAPQWPVSLAMGETTTFSIKYAPTAVGTHSATFTISDGRANTTLNVSGACYDPTIYDFPWVEGFTNTTFPPAEWARYSGLYDDQNPYTLTPTTYGWRRAANFANVSDSGNPCARINIFSTTTRYWLVTPPIAIPATGYQLDFDLALSYWNGSGVAVTPGEQQDDKFIVLISDNPDMSGATELKRWDNAGSTDVYDNIAPLGEAIAIDLSAHVGTKYIAFYGESTEAGGDNYLYVDQVRVRETPTAPIFSHAPDAIEFYTTYVNTATAYQNVTVTNIGIGTLTLNPGDVSIVGTDAAMFQVDPNLQSLALTADQSGNIPVRYNPTATGTHTATLRMSYGGNNYDVALTGRAVGANALLESFEDTTFPPMGWDAGNWGRTTFITPVQGSASANVTGSTSTQYVLSTPMLTVTADSSIDFWTRCTNSTAYLQVVYSTDRTNWTQVGSDFSFAEPNEPNTWYNVNVDLSTLAGNNYYIGFRTGLTGGSYYVDMVVGPNITPLAPGAPGLVSPADAAIEVSVTPTFTWTVPTTGGIPTSYKIYCDANTNPTTLIGTSTELSFTPTTPLPYNTPLYWTVKAVNAVGDGPAATPRSFTTLPEGLVYIGNGTSNGYLPIYPYYNFNYSQTIYLQSDINIPDKRVEQIAFYWNGAAAGTNSKGWTVYMAHTNKDSFTDGQDWVPYDNLTQVYTGELNLPATAGWVDITLDAPFVYNNTDNLLIAVYENTPGNSGSSGYFYSTSVTGTRALLYYDDNTNPNPATPPDAAAYYSQRNAYANIKMQFGDIPPSPVFAYAPVTIDFGAGFVNTPMAYQDVTVSNTGAGTLNLAVANVSIIGTDAAMFELNNSNLPFALATNESGTIPVRYNPTAVGTHTATLRMVHDGNNYDVALSGRALSENALFESFEATSFPPAGWDKGNWSTSTTPFHGTKSASKYGSASTQYVLSTPMLAIDTDSRLNFWTRCTNTSGILQVVYSTDRVSWVQLGSDITFDASNTWYNVDIDLSTLAGNNYYLGFQTGLYAATYYVDYVIGPDFAAIAPEAPTLTAPADAATDLNPNPTFTWTASSTGGVPTSYNIYCDASTMPTTLIGTSTTTSFTPTVGLPYSSTLYWTVTAVNTTDESAPATPRSFTTMADPTVYTIPFTEGFEEGQTHGAQVKNWVQHLESGSNYWMANSTNTDYYRTPRNGDFNATLRWSSNAWLMRPFSLQGGVAYDVEVWARQNTTTAANATVGLYYGSSGTIDGMTAIVEQTGVVSGDYQQIRGTFTPETTGIHWIGIHGVVAYNPMYMSIDDISVTLAPTAPVFTYTPDAINFGTLLYNTLSNPVLVTITNEGSGTIDLSTSSFSFVGPNAADFSVGTTDPALPVDLGRDESVTVPVTVQSTTEGPISATLRIAYGGTNYDVALSANILPEDIFFVGEGTTANSNTGAPCVYGGYYKNGREQYIFTAAELTALGAQAGIIKTLGFNVQNPNTSANLPNFTISIGATTATEFADTNFLTGLTQAYSTGTGTYTPVAGWNSHNLTSPFYWDGVSNLVVQTSYDLLPSAVLNASTYYTDTTVNKTLYYRHDSTEWNTVTTGTLSNYRPNMMIYIDEPIAGAPAAPTLVSPADGATGLPKAGFELKWSPDLNNGGVPDYYAVFLSTDPDDVFSGTYWETTNTGLNPVLADPPYSYTYGQRYYWTIQAINTHGDAVQTTSYSFVIEDDPVVYSYPWTENFDALAAGEMPAQWTIISSPANRPWKASSGVGATSLPNAAAVFYSSSYPKDEWMITVPFSMQANQAYRISFQVKGEGWNEVPEQLAVHWGTQPTVASMTANAALFDGQLTYPNWTQMDLFFTPVTTGLYYLGWHAKSPVNLDFIAVDDIRVSEAFAADLEALFLGGSPYGKVGVAKEQYVTVNNAGMDAQSNYTVYIKEQGSGATLGQLQVSDVINSLESKVHTVSWTPTAAGTTAIYAEVVLAGDQNVANNTTAAKDVTVYAASSSFLTIGDAGNLQMSNVYPFNVYYKDFVAETVYLASEVQATGGTINALVYYNHFQTDHTSPVQIWMKNTDAVNVGAWLPWDGYQLVFDGNIFCPEGINAVHIPITPFTYTGGNLAIRTSKTWEDGWVQNCFWLNTPDANYPSRTRYVYSDGADGTLDHAAPTGGYASNNVPYTIFIMDPASLVTTLAAPTVSVTLSDTNAVLDWPAIPYAYNYKVYVSEDPYNFGTVPAATVYTNTATMSTTAGKGFYKVTANTYRDSARGLLALRNLSKMNIVPADDNPIVRDMKDINGRRKATP